MSDGWFLRRLTGVGVEEGVIFHIPKPGARVLYILPLLHPEDIDEDFVSGNQVFYLPQYTCCEYVCSTSGHV